MTVKYRLIEKDFEANDWMNTPDAPLFADRDEPAEWLRANGVHPDAWHHYRVIDTTEQD